MKKICLEKRESRLAFQQIRASERDNHIARNWCQGLNVEKKDFFVEYLQ